MTQPPASCVYCLIGYCQRPVPAAGWAPLRVACRRGTGRLTIRRPCAGGEFLGHYQELRNVRLLGTEVFCWDADLPDQLPSVEIQGVFGATLHAPTQRLVIKFYDSPDEYQFVA